MLSAGDALWPPPSATAVTGSQANRPEVQQTKPRPADAGSSEMEQKMSLSDEDDDDNELDEEMETMEPAVSDTRSPYCLRLFCHVAEAACWMLRDTVCVFFRSLLLDCLKCFDAVGWAAGRAYVL